MFKKRILTKKYILLLDTFLTNPYQITIEATAEMLFESVSSEPQKINDLELQLFPWIPLSLNNRTLSSTVNNVVQTIYNPHPELLSKWKNSWRIRQ